MKLIPKFDRSGKIVAENDAIQSQRPVVKPLLSVQQQVRAKQLEQDAAFARFAEEHKDDKPSTDTRTSAQRNRDYWHPIKGVADRYRTAKDNNTDLFSQLATKFDYPLYVAAALPLANELMIAKGLGGIGSYLTVLGRQGLNYLSAYLGSKAGKKALGAVGNAIDNNFNLSNFGVLGQDVGEVAGMGLGFTASDQLTGDHIRRALYNNLSPYGYGNANEVGINHNLELTNAAKDIFNPLRWKELYQRTSVNGEPVWMTNMKGRPVTLKDGTVISNPNHLYVTDEAFGSGDNMINGRTMMQFRDDAWRKAMRLRQRPGHDLYVSNGDGTYSYNMDYVNRVRRANGDYEFDVMEVPRTPADRKAAYGYYEPIDQVTGNGGFTNEWQFNPDGTYSFTDIWDLQPFLDKGRLLKFDNPIFNKAASSFPKFEAVSAVGGEPIRLVHTGTWNPPRLSIKFE